MIYEHEPELRDRIEEVAHRRLRGAIAVAEDTTNYMGIEAGTVLRLEGADYFVSGEANEGRFGIGDQPKYWVKYAFDLETGDRKIIKLVFHEEFTAALGLFTVRCTRSPEKESRVLDLVRGDLRFMQGQTVRDCRGNNVRVIEHIRGPSLYVHLASLEVAHEEYFATVMPGVLEDVVGCIDALSFLHANGLQHGDIRNDHILIETGTGRYRWIDFDYEVNFSDFDVWSIGNILTYVVARGICTCQDARQVLGSAKGPSECDALVFFKHRLANLKKLYPYIPDPLNEVLLRFSRNTTEFYESLPEVTRDLRAVLAAL